MEKLPGKPNVAVFDTAFHQTMPEKAYMYAIPYEYYEKYRIRKYGAHGTSHKFVSNRVAELMNKPLEDLKIISCHLGQGASLCAVENGKSVDTSMGLTPLAGVPMGSRSGDIDPSVVTFLMEKERQELLGLHCETTVDGYTDFIFVNRFGECQHHSTINKGIDRIIRDCNEEQLAKCESGTIKPKNLVLLPKFSCHSLRHTCATRLCEAGINMKVIQDVLGHADITTTMNIYTEATKNLKKKEIDKFAEFLSATTTFEGKEEND